MTAYVKKGKLYVSSELYQFINNEGLPESGVEENKFWSGLERLVEELTPKNRELLAIRTELQAKINSWHREHFNCFDSEMYQSFLLDIGYLEPEVEAFTITTSGVDEEITVQAGPQLVVPVNNARYAINAANARWGSLYDALYGTDAISDEGGAHRTAGYNPVRGEKVIAFAREFLDQSAPLRSATHKDVVEYSIKAGKLTVLLKTGEVKGLQEEGKFIGYRGDPQNPDAILLKNNGLHFEIQIDRNSAIGQIDLAG
ncbi:MAG: malate synthase G, partial [Bacillota bacterium]|nr:malate synthase G [Bacillota bacterium]